jgi:hypothetical protein
MMNEKNENETRMRKTRMQELTIGKSDIRYWQKRVRKTRSNRGERVSENAFYLFELQYGGRRMGLSLGTANQMEAAARAKERYLFLIANGWEAFLARYRPKETLPSASTLTVGQYLDAVRSQTELSPTTIEGYAKKFRQIVADIANVKGTKTRFDYRKSGFR